MSEKAEAVELFAQSLGSDDEVVLEATGGAMAIARILRPHVRRVVVANAADVRAISWARVKSDRFDARTLARLLAADLIPEVWIPDEDTQALRRRVARRAALIRQLVRTKNEVHAVVMRCLLGRPPVSDLFGKKGRAWLAAQDLPLEEAETADSGRRQLDSLHAENENLPRALALWLREYKNREVSGYRLVNDGGSGKRGRHRWSVQKRGAASP